MSRTFFAITDMSHEPATAEEAIAPIEPIKLPLPAKRVPPKAVVTPAPKPMPKPKPEVVPPVDPDDMIIDDGSVPFIEVGGPRPASSIPIVRKIVAPQPQPQPAPSVIVEPAAKTYEYSHKPVKLLNVSFQPMPDPKLYSPGGTPIASDLVTFHQPAHPVSMQYRQLQNQIASQLPKVDRAMILLTSVRGGSGASTAALNIAISRTYEHKGRVLLLDANPGQPTLASRIGCADQPGLSEILISETPLGLSIQPTEMPNLHLLAWGRSEKHLTDAHWAKLPTIVSRLMQRFEWIIVDGPHRLESLKRWIALSDGIYMVVRQDEWDSPHVDQAHDAIRNSGGKLRGCLMTAA